VVRLQDDRPLGLYEDSDGFFRSEYQIGRRLVWVRCPHQEMCNACLSQTDALLPEIWAAIPDAIVLAEDHSRTVYPAFWLPHDESTIGENRMDVWGITITPMTGLSSFHVSENHDFPWDRTAYAKDDEWRERPLRLPRFPDRHFVYLDRDTSGALSVSSSRQR
jgi:hypothetical protein